MFSLEDFPLLRVTNSAQGIFPGIFGGRVPPGSLNPDSILGYENVIFHTRFQTWYR